MAFYFRLFLRPQGIISLAYFILKCFFISAFPDSREKSFYVLAKPFDVRTNKLQFNSVWNASASR